MQVMTGKNYQDLYVHRRFTFEPQLSNVTNSRCPCPQHRQLLHRRIEKQFKRLFQQMLQPLSNLHERCVQHIMWHVPHYPHIYRPASYKEANLATAPVVYCRPPYRERFPKWVPVLTLYREIVQNPLKRKHRCRLMLMRK